MSNSFITRRASQTNKTITFDGYTDGLTPEVGIDGVSKWFNAPDLSAERASMAATHVGNYALFAGGNFYIDDFTNIVDAYNESLEKSTPTPLSVARDGLAATHIGDYALFAGGSSRSNGVTSTIDVYDSSLHRTTPISLSQARAWLSATHVGDYALFAGGEKSYTERCDTVDVYRYSLNALTPVPAPTQLSAPTSSLAATHVGNYALFGGGMLFEGQTISTDVVYAYNTSLDRSTPTPLSAARSTTATHVGNYALFAGGSSILTYYFDIVDAYNTSLERLTPSPTPLSQKRRGLSATHIGNYALFAGGGDSDYNHISEAEVYDTSLARSTLDFFNNEGISLRSTYVGNYALFACSERQPGQKTVYVCTTPAQKTKITLPPNVSYTFGSLSGTTTQPTEISPDYPLFGTVTVS